MFSLLRRLSLNLRPETRLTPAHVMQRAGEAAQAAHINATFGVLSLRRIGGRLLWIASTVTKGSAWRVTVDDATGKLGPVRRWGVR